MIITCEENTIFVPQGDAYDTVYVSTDILTINKKVIVAQHIGSGYSIVTNTTSEEIQLKNTSKNTIHTLSRNKRVLLANGDYNITQCPENGLIVNNEIKLLNDTITINVDTELHLDGSSV